MIGNLNHIAIAVPDLEAAIKQYEKTFGAFVTSPTDLPQHGIRLAIVNLLNTKIELMTPLDNTSPIAKFLERNPVGGIHHLSYVVPDIIAARDQLKNAGIQVIGDGTPQMGYHDTRVLFFNPKDCLGVLIELQETKAAVQKDRVAVKSAVHTGHHSNKPSLEGVDGIGINVNVDFKSKTPKDNLEKN
ncbi:MAG: Methylmalonyl-CoA epimerase [uncultured bacterium]|nr:MAG: Methylmalonyl-CoA epimerase [uncultured bacterium]OFW68883.1 MAG: methylmalonyl-CoA epimerase [Alphaproteobacteria bacterium GWC2_42_16]OFW73626.1 MAG: methylmalonyl-CoA epimerase [Alphaproteobacteria bacterium GWA2_41_27]OFW81941.1 MAG: methylmalonyl-CoA epimerase [Alphaproteobacteria bacterium RIFCSPHIGHO2_12_FULL_42_100]OFW84958.1 MAG: methylmalonyl-CoA epimerase [Alphaproteobacteria bacterium RBG_16_42_14]OFW91072.1 MAG: methylmalonyl-CoA epimerase [Alphaproteobacteria bacterium RI